MKFDVYGPYELPKKRGRIVTRDLPTFWKEKVESEDRRLTDACGCYVLGTWTSGSQKATPWYVGKAEKSTFKKRLLQGDSVSKLNDVLVDWEKACPVLFLLPNLTGKNGFSKPTATKNRSIQGLELILISMAFKENPELINNSGVTNLREIEVIGFMNPKSGKRLAKRHYHGEYYRDGAAGLLNMFNP